MWLLNDIHWVICAIAETASFSGVSKLREAPMLLDR